MNPAEVFGDIMIDYSYVECTSACVQSLVAFSLRYPEHPRVPEARAAVAEGAAFVCTKQRGDGSFYGSWAVCFTYGGWFAVDALGAAVDLGAAPADAAERCARAVRFLLGRQGADGGWGESCDSCAHKEYVPHEAGSQVINTSWALLTMARAAEIAALAAASSSTTPEEAAALAAEVAAAAAKAERFIRGRQLGSGDWAQEGVSGVFNKTCAISYSNYRNVFPIWALSRYALVFGGL